MLDAAIRGRRCHLQVFNFVAFITNNDRGIMSHPIKNMYVDVLDPKYLDKPRTFDRQQQIHLNLLATFIAVGSTGSFKTNSMLQIILAYGPVWDSFTLCSRTLDEPLYRWFKDYMAEEKRQGKIKWFRICDDLLDLPLLDRPKQLRPCTESDDGSGRGEQRGVDEPYYYGKQKQLNHCIVVDDIIMESPKKLAVLCDFFTRGRKYGITLFVMSQDWYRTPPYWKRNATYFVFKALPPRQLKRIAGDVTNDVAPSEFAQRYSAAIQEKHDFFLVDKSPSSSGNLELMFRRNLG
jgi:hypothetical protein